MYVALVAMLLAGLVMIVCTKQPSTVVGLLVMMSLCIVSVSANIGYQLYFISRR